MATVAQWKKARVHTVTLPSGTKVDIQVPDLPALIASGDLPQHLVDAALAATGEKQPEITTDFVRQENEFMNEVVKITVVDPQLTDKDLPEIPFEDKEFISSIATRQTDLDAEGNHIGGLHTSEKFRKFRGLDRFDSTLEDV